ncbi:uncharacterized protein MELLADRAFT_109024 [Melampsora larici-populina 98AG31]|uniref:CxC5 like cysteine cluster associated with KDZ domain-containing protein n=1 Tax=Melampsora larici-populina (strain 98AG31 / pathotype 3-4-7) TaxID=747676 RepID=F4RV28_MELLP|nr:uncharacterized protein MELLADRAFT_109024 [Melampsora larici-populina 98AG31]EGG03805.1 hypothetical protein MELLADRAFT_109024 [Melampsora larici-populina 98AG31]
MLLRDFVDLMTRDSPRLSATLSVADFVRFVSLAGEVQHRAGQSVRLTPNRNTLLPFLELALSPHYPHDLLPDLWRLSFPLLDASRINTSAAIRDFGLHPELLGTKMPERFLRAPMSHCTLCSRDHSFALHVHSCLDGYLYDIDGVHAIQTVILCCSRNGSQYDFPPHPLSLLHDNPYVLHASGASDVSPMTPPSINLSKTKALPRRCPRKFAAMA